MILVVNGSSLRPVHVLIRPATSGSRACSRFADHTLMRVPVNRQSEPRCQVRAARFSSGDDNDTHDLTSNPCSLRRLPEAVAQDSAIKHIRKLAGFFRKSRTIMQVVFQLLIAQRTEHVSAYFHKGRHTMATFYFKANASAMLLTSRGQHQKLKVALAVRQRHSIHNIPRLLQSKSAHRLVMLLRLTDSFHINTASCSSISADASIPNDGRANGMLEMAGCLRLPVIE